MIEARRVLTARSEKLAGYIATAKAEFAAWENQAKKRQAVLQADLAKAEALLTQVDAALGQLGGPLKAEQPSLEPVESAHGDLVAA